jgi:hypothetical protein
MPGSRARDRHVPVAAARGGPHVFILDVWPRKFCLFVHESLRCGTRPRPAPIDRAAMRAPADGKEGKKQRKKQRKKHGRSMA